MGGVQLVVGRTIGDESGEPATGAGGGFRCGFFNVSVISLSPFFPLQTRVGWFLSLFGGGEGGGMEN